MIDPKAGDMIFFYDVLQQNVLATSEEPTRGALIESVEEGRVRATVFFDEDIHSVPWSTEWFVTDVIELLSGVRNGGWGKIVLVPRDDP